MNNKQKIISLSQNNKVNLLILFKIGLINTKYIDYLNIMNINGSKFNFLYKYISHNNITLFINNIDNMINNKKIYITINSNKILLLDYLNDL